MKTYKASIEDFIHKNQAGWAELEFFRSGRAQEIAEHLDAMVEQGRTVFPHPTDVLRALELTKWDNVRVVIIGQDPYPQPGNANGLAFSVPSGQKIPASLRTIFDAYTSDLGLSRPNDGDLSAWARNGILLLNHSLTVEKGLPNSHKKIGWSELVAEVLTRQAKTSDGTIYMAWGTFAQKLIRAHLSSPSDAFVINCAHPSPLARASQPKGSPHPFVAAQPFAKANQYLQECGKHIIDWRLQ